MQNFRQFEAGPDPFGRKYTVYFKWLQTAISLRHADAVDVKFILEDETGARTEKTIALPHPEILRISRTTSRPMDDAWCARLAMRHLLYLIETGEDIEKDLITTSAPDLERYAQALADSDRAELQAK
jgi:hypothetical protein